MYVLPYHTCATITFLTINRAEHEPRHACKKVGRRLHHNYYTLDKGQTACVGGEK